MARTISQMPTSIPHTQEEVSFRSLAKKESVKRLSGLSRDDFGRVQERLVDVAQSRGDRDKAGSVMTAEPLAPRGPTNNNPYPHPPSHSELALSLRPAYGNHEPNHSYVSLQNTERGARNSPMDHPRQRGQSPCNNHTMSATSDPTIAEAGGYSGVGRKGSLVRPEGKKIKPDHRRWHYRSHAAGESSAIPGVNAMPSRMNLISWSLAEVSMC